MTKVIFKLPDGQTREQQAIEGHTLMEVARQGNVAGIVAECGGSGNCATCHVYVEHDWINALPQIEPLEEDLLDCVPERRAGSRLSCQIFINAELDGLTVEVPEMQY